MHSKLKEVVISRAGYYETNTAESGEKSKREMTAWRRTWSKGAATGAIASGKKGITKIMLKALVSVKNLEVTVFTNTSVFILLYNI